MSITMADTVARCVPRVCVLAAGLLAVGLGLAAGAMAEGSYGGPYGFGTPATAEEIAAIDIDAMPDGRGLPPGEGGYEAGKQVYTMQCLACHGADLGGVKGTGGAALIGGRGSLASGKPKKTVESYWPYASTLFDFTKRAMPFHTPGSMTDNDIYAVTAYILAEGNIIGKDEVMNAETLPKVVMPNVDGFIPDPRPDIFNYD